MSLSVSTAGVSRWSSLCSSVRRTCLASARGSTRSCVTVASTTERLDDSCLRLADRSPGSTRRSPSPSPSDGLFHRQPVTQPYTTWPSAFFYGEPRPPSLPLRDWQRSVRVSHGAPGDLWELNNKPVAEQSFTCKLAKNYWCGPLLTPPTCWTRTFQVAFAFSMDRISHTYSHTPGGFQPNGQKSRL